MFNCYVVILNGRPFAFFHTEQACDNFIHMMNERTSVPSDFTIEGRFVDGIGF